MLGNNLLDKTGVDEIPVVAYSSAFAAVKIEPTVRIRMHDAAGPEPAITRFFCLSLRFIDIGDH
jgi:hypothetical protein